MKNRNKQKQTNKKKKMAKFSHFLTKGIAVSSAFFLIMALPSLETLIMVIFAQCFDQNIMQNLTVDEIMRRFYPCFDFLLRPI